MKKVLLWILTLALSLGLCACGEDGKELSKGEMLAEATTAFAHEITLDIAGNKARAKSYEDRIYRITGHICEIEEDYCLVVARSVDGDNSSHIHSDGWYGFNCDTVFKVHLSTKELANLNLCDGIEFVGVVNKVGTREYHAVKDQIYLEFENAYYLGSAEYEGQYRL